MVDDDQATIAIEALVSSGFVPWLEDPAATAGWVDAAAFDLRPPHGGLGLSLDLHWRLEYGGLRYGGNGADRRDGGQGVDPSRSDVNWAAGGGSRQLPETDASVGPVGAEEHLALIVEHFLKHMRFRIHLAALADVVRLGERVCKWERVLETLDRGSWGQAGRAFLGGIAAASPSPVWEPLRDPGLAKPSLLRRLDPLQLVREAGEAQPRRALGVFERWQLQGPRAVLRDLRSAASPPDAWLRSRYGAPDGASTAGLRARHLLRVSGWALGLTPSPLSPNQDQSPEA